MRSISTLLVTAALIMALPLTAAADTAGEVPDPMGPAFFTSRCCGEAWQPSDPRIAGTWTESQDWTTLSYSDDGGDDESEFDIGWGDVRIENAAGTWVGSYHWFTEVDEDAEYAITARLTGQEAYEGLSAIAVGIVDDDRVRPLRLDGVIYPTGTLPDDLDGVEGSDPSVGS